MAACPTQDGARRWSRAPLADQLAQEPLPANTPSGNEFGLIGRIFELPLSEVQNLCWLPFSPAEGEAGHEAVYAFRSQRFYHVGRSDGFDGLYENVQV